MPRRPQGARPAKPLLGPPVAADAKHAGARRSGQRPTGGSPPPRRAIARREGRRADPRGLRVVRLRDRAGGGQEHLDPPAPPTVLRSAHGKDRRGGGREGRGFRRPFGVVPPRPRPGWMPRSRDPAESSESDEAAASKGHGRNGADAYRGAARIDGPASVARCGRRVSRLRSGNGLREGPGRAGADHRAAAAGSDGLRVAETALPSLRPGLHGARAGRGWRRRSTTPRPAA